MKDFKYELQRTLWVLGIEKGEIQNYIDIQGWKEFGYLNEEEANELRTYNAKLCRMH